MSSADLKESWLTECFKWFPKRDDYKGKYDAAGIVPNGISPVLLIFLMMRKKAGYNHL